MRAAEQLRHLHARQQGRHGRDLRRRPADARERAPERRSLPVRGRPAGRAERGVQHRRARGLHRARRDRVGRRLPRRQSRDRARPHRRRARDHALGSAAPREPQGRRPHPLRPAHPLRVREDAEVGRRRGRARGDPGRHLRRHRRPRRPDRHPARLGRAALHLPGRVRGAQAVRAEGHPALRPARLRQDADREGGRQQPREEHREAHRQGDHAVLPQRQGPRAA